MPKNESDDWWRLDAACRGMAFEEESFDTFYPDTEHEKGLGTIVRVTPKAVEVCSTCTVTAECLDYAMRNHIQDGTWGGLSPGQRKNLHRQNLRDEEKLFEILERDFKGVLKG